MSLFIPITKVDVAKRLVYGTISEEVPDKTGEILDYESAKPAFKEWSDQFRQASGGKSLGNVRAMHGQVAAGKLTDIAFDDEHKRIDGVAKIVDDDEWQKVLEGVYTGFSIGGGYAKRWPDTARPDLMRYTPTLSEVSLVDNPAVPTATFEVVKHDGSIELRKFNPNPEASSMTKITQPAIQPDYTDDDESRIADILEGLDWLAQMMRQQGDYVMVGHIQALQDCLSEEEDGDEDEENEDNEDDDDTSSHGYAGELARMSRRPSARNSPQDNRKYIAEFSAQIAALHKRVTQLEAQPAAAKGILRAVRKSDDRAPDDSASDPLVRLTPQERARELMKIALSNPVQW